MNQFLNKLHLNKIISPRRFNTILNFGEVTYSSSSKMENVLVVKNNILSFNIGTNNQGNKHLEVIEYCLDGYKEAQLQLSEDEANILRDSLKNLHALPFEYRSTLLCVGEENNLKISTETSHIGPLCIISHVNGLYKKMQPLKFPWNEAKNFTNFLTNSFVKSESN